MRTRIDYDDALVGARIVQIQIAPLLPFSTDIIALAENKQRLDFIKADAAAKAMADIAAKVTAASAARRAPASRRRSRCAPHRKWTRSGRPRAVVQFFNGYDPPFTAAVPKPYQELSKR